MIRMQARRSSSKYTFFEKDDVFNQIPSVTSNYSTLAQL